MSKKPHSIKVPTQYRATAKILKAALEQQKCIKTLIFAEKHAVSGLDLSSADQTNMRITFPSRTSLVAYTLFAYGSEKI